MVDHVKFFLESSLITMQNMVVVSLYVHVGHKIFWGRWAHPVGIGA